MCEWGNNEIIEVTIPSHLSHTGEDIKKKMGVDKCIAPIVKALNNAGIETIAACCGHYKGPGSIVLLDGRELVICENVEAAKSMRLHLPDIIIDDMIRILTDYKNIISELIEKYGDKKSR